MSNKKRLIDANALLEKIQFRLPVDDHISECIDECVKMARQIINDAHTVDAEEVVHGRWIRYEHGSGIFCSHCHHKRRYRDAHDNYCPNCGAKMDGGSRNE